MASSSHHMQFAAATFVPPPPVKSPEQIAEELIQSYGTLLYAQSKGKLEIWRAALQKISGQDLKLHHFKESRFIDI